MTTEYLGQQVQEHLRALGIDRVSDLGLRVGCLLEQTFGLHRIPQRKLRAADWTSSSFIKLAISATLATTDPERLTRLVFLAHDYCVRLEIEPVNMQYLGLCFTPRTRDGSPMQRQLSLEAAVTLHRQSFPAQPEMFQSQIAAKSNIVAKLFDQDRVGYVERLETFILRAGGLIPFEELERLLDELDAEAGDDSAYSDDEDADVLDDGTDDWSE